MKARSFVLPLCAVSLALSALAPSASAQEPAVAATTARTASTAAAAEPRLITVDEVRSQLDHGMKIVFVDARSPVTGAAIEGAVNVPIDKVDEWAKGVSPETVVVTYCGCPTEGGSKAVAARLQALGFTSVFALKGGIGAWQAAGLPTETVASN